jgi:uncharacterized protein
VLDPDEGVAADGTISTGVSRSRVPPAFEPVLSTAAEAITEAARGASVYVYGSVATGRAGPPQSDVDLAAFGLDTVTARRIGRELSGQFSGLCRGVEIYSATPGSLTGGADQAYGNRVFLRHYCVHIAGPDHRHGLPRFPADARAARGFNGDIAQHAACWRHALEAGEEPRRLGRRLARKTLLAVAGLVSVHDASWTTDRALAAHRWAELQPDLGPALLTLLAWSDGQALPGGQAVQNALDTTIPPIATAFATTIGLWP